MPGINFIGSIEARDIPAGYADVIVCEAFVGNVILKLYEGLGSTFMKMLKTGLMKDTRSKVGALLVKPAVKETMKAFDASEYGGAPLLGLKGLVVKTHGSARAVEIRHAIFQCVQFRQQKINEKIAAHMVEETPEKGMIIHALQQTLRQRPAGGLPASQREGSLSWKKS